MRKKLTSTLFVAMMLSMTWANVPFASATTPPSTSLSISSAYNGTIVDNGFVYTSAAPNITLSVANPPNSTFYSTEYTIGVNGNITPYQGPFTLNLNYSSELELRYRSNGSSGLESWKSLTISVDADAPSISLTAGAGLAMSASGAGDAAVGQRLAAVVVLLAVACSPRPGSRQA